jgi:hypothetical protein
MKKLSEDEIIAILLVIVAPLTGTVALLMLNNMNSGFRDYGSCIDLYHTNPKYHGSFPVIDIVLVNSTTNETIVDESFDYQIGLCNASSCEGYYIYFWCFQNSLNDTLYALQNIPDEISYNQVWLKVESYKIFAYGYQTLLSNKINYISIKSW